MTPQLVVAVMLVVITALALSVQRWRSRRSRSYVRLRVVPYRTDRATVAELVVLLEAVHRRLLERWWTRLAHGQPSVALELHWIAREQAPGEAMLALCVPAGREAEITAALRSAYPNVTTEAFPAQIGRAAALVRLKKRRSFIHALHVHEDPDAEPDGVQRLLTAMRATGVSSLVQVVLTPAPALLEDHARSLFKARERQLSQQRASAIHEAPVDRSELERASLLRDLAVQGHPLFFAEIRVAAGDRRACAAVAAELRTRGTDNQLVERGVGVRDALTRCYTRRLAEGVGNPLPGLSRGVYAAPELVGFWHVPSTSFTGSALDRRAIPDVPAGPAILRPADGRGLLTDGHGPVTIAPDLRRQNTAVPGTVEQGKSSYLVATVAEDLRRERCAIIVLDPKGDAAEAAISAVPLDRTCTVLDFAAPTCGFNPLTVDASPDTIADFVVAAMRNLFDEGDIRASSDRYLRNAIIAVLAHDRGSTLWDAMRLLSVTEEGYAFREHVGERIRGLPEFKEIGEFFTQELRAQLQDARGMTTSKLDAPVNKAARLLNSPSIKRVLLNTSLRVDLDRVIADGEVLIVKGALGAMGEGNTSVLMQLLMGMLDAALARQQDLVPQTDRVAVALKVDEAPLVINRGFATTMALKRSAGLETVACWQSDAQWTDPVIREQLDALFAHRVYFATASATDARAASDLLMTEYADQVRPDAEHTTLLACPDARLHLTKHRAIASWVTSSGRQPPFLGQTIPLAVDRQRIAGHLDAQRQRGGAALESFRQPHWDRIAPDMEDSAGAEVTPHEVAQDIRATHATDPTGERELDDFAQLRGALRARPASAPTAPANARPSPVATKAPGATEQVDPAPPRRGPAASPPITYVELAAVDEATRVSWPRHVEHKPMKPRHADLELLAWLARLRFALATQLHRRFHADQSYSTTQRHLRRLSQAGWVGRFQFFRDNGASSALVYVITADGLKALDGRVGPRGPYLDPRRTRSSPSTKDPAMRTAQHDLHVNAWVIALEEALGPGVGEVRGPQDGYLPPPHRNASGEKLWIGPTRLQLPGGRTPHGFLETDGARERKPVAAFRPVAPDATVELRLGAGAARWHSDLFVEMDRTFRPAKNVSKFERYDHLLSGWVAMKDRYAKHCNALPIVVFVCRDDANAKDFCRAADAVVTAAHAYGGEYASEWAYPGRRHVFFVAERDLHEGSTRAYALPDLPPDARVAAANGDRRARACHPRLVSFLPVQ